MSVRVGDSILLSMAQGGYVFLDCKMGRHFRLNRSQFKAEALVSAQYGASFAVEGDGKLVAITRKSLNLMSTFVETSRGGAEYVVRLDNRDLNDNNKAQSLDATSIRAMRLRGEPGVAIIEALAAGSATWNSKTDFSKAKWLKRKAKKYIPWVQVLEPTAVAVTEAYFCRIAGHGRTCRPDAIAQLLASSNIGAGSRVIVVDSFHGIILGAVVERAGPTGNVLLLHEGPRASADAINKFNFPSDVRKSISIAPVDICFTEALRYAAKVFAQERVTDLVLTKPAASSPRTHSTTLEAALIERDALGLNPLEGQTRQGTHTTCHTWFKQKAHALVSTGVEHGILIFKY